MLNNTLDFLLGNRVQVFSIIGSLLLFGFIWKLVKRQKLKEEYSLLWLGLGMVFIFLSLFKPMLEVVASTLGILYAPAALLLILVLSVFLILIQFSVIISKLAEQNKNLIQEVGILKADLKKLQTGLQEKNK